MPEFKIEFTEEVWNRVFIEAATEEEATEKFWNCDFEEALMENFGSEIQDGILVEEVTE